MPVHDTLHRLGHQRAGIKIEVTSRDQSVSLCRGKVVENKRNKVVQAGITLIDRRYSIDTENALCTIVALCTIIVCYSMVSRLHITC